MKNIVGLLVLSSLALTACNEKSGDAAEKVQTPTTAVAQQAAPDAKMDSNEEKPHFFAENKYSTTAAIEAINRTTREVTLRTSEDELVTFTAGEDVRNFAQLNVGDLVHVSYSEALDVSTASIDDAKADVAVAEFVATAKAGAKPGMQKVDTIIITAVIEEINIENNTFKLKGPEGKVEEYTAQDPENLKKVSVGDVVKVKVTTTVTVSVAAPE